MLVLIGIAVKTFGDLISKQRTSELRGFGDVAHVRVNQIHMSNSVAC